MNQKHCWKCKAPMHPAQNVRCMGPNNETVCMDCYNRITESIQQPVMAPAINWKKWFRGLFVSSLLLLTAQAQAAEIRDLAVNVPDGVQILPLIDPVTHTATPQDLKEAERLRNLTVPISSKPSISEEFLNRSDRMFMKTMPSNVKWKREILKDHDETRINTDVTYFLNGLESWQAQAAKIVLLYAGYSQDYMVITIFYPVRKEGKE